MSDIFNNENKEIKLKANTKEIIIKIPTQLLYDCFEDEFGMDFKITNKKKFRENFALELREQLENEVVSNIFDCISENTGIKCLED